MSQENVEIVRRALDALNRDGIEAVLEFLDPDVEWTTTGLFVEAGTYRGHDGVLRYFGAMANDLEFHIEPEKFIDGGDQVVIPTRIAVRGKRSGATQHLRGGRGSFSGSRHRVMESQWTPSPLMIVISGELGRSQPLSRRVHGAGPLRPRPTRARVSFGAG